MSGLKNDRLLKDARKNVSICRPISSMIGHNDGKCGAKANSQFMGANLTTGGPVAMLPHSRKVLHSHATGRFLRGAACSPCSSIWEN